MTTMTIHVEDDFAEALRAHARAVGTSVNRAGKELLSPLEDRGVRKRQSLPEVLRHPPEGRGGPSAGLRRAAANDRRGDVEMTDTLLLDSNALIALFDGDRDVARIMASAPRIAVPAVVCGEIDAGTQGDTARAREEREAFSELLAMPNVSVLPVTRTTGSFYARVFAYSHSVGRPIPTNDVWIAAAVLETAGILCTDARHLLSLPLVRTIRYR